MSVLFEHDTAQKTRRAIIVTSVVIIVLHYVQLGSNELEIFKLKILVEKDNIVVFLKLGLAYLVYMYFVYEFGTYYEDRNKRLLERIKSEVIENARSDAFMRTQTRDEKLNEIEQEFNMRENARILRLALIMRILRDYFPVYLFVLLAFSGFHEGLLDRLIVQPSVEEQPIETEPEASNGATQ